MNNESLQTQQGVGNKSTVWQDTQEGSKATSWQSGQRNEAFLEQTFGGSNNLSTVNQTGQDNYAAAEHLNHVDGDIQVYQDGHDNWAYGDQREGTGGTIGIGQYGGGNSVEVWQDTQVGSQASVVQTGQTNEAISTRASAPATRSA